MLYYYIQIKVNPWTGERIPCGLS